MRVTVTGGAGFIGGHLVESLLDDGHGVTVIDDLSTGSLDNLREVADSPMLEFIEGDILTYPGLGDVIAGSDMVYHLAAAVGVQLVVEDPVRTIETNVHGTERVLKYSAEKGTKLLLTSTSEVYGKSVKSEFSETDDLLIGPPTHSRWSYASSKLLDEFFAMAYFKDRALPVIIVRLFNTVGPRQTGQYGMVLPRFVSRALDGRDLRVFGDGEQSRCFCHVTDTVRALRLLGDNPEAYGKIFNIGGSSEMSINNLAKLVVSTLGSSSGIVHIPYEEAYEKGFEDMRRRLPDTRRINVLTGWKPEFGLEKIIADVAECMVKHGT